MPTFGIWIFGNATAQEIIQKYVYEYVNISWVFSTVFVAINYGALTHIKDIAKRHL